jgi:hypothetical protein
MSHAGRRENDHFEGAPRPPASPAPGGPGPRPADAWRTRRRAQPRAGDAGLVEQRHHLARVIVPSAASMIGVSSPPWATPYGLVAKRGSVTSSRSAQHQRP